MCHLQIIVSSVVAVTIALHSALGCCWHHSHARPSDLSDVRANAPTASLRCRCHRAIGTTRAEKAPLQVDSQSDRETPCGEKCDLVAKTRTQRADTTASRIVASSSPVDERVLLCDASVSHLRRVEASLEPPPIRLHLLLQILLI